MIIKSTENYRAVHSTQIENKKYVVIFDSLVEAKTAFRDLEIRHDGAYNVVHFQTKENCWWQRGGLTDVMHALQNYLPNDSEVVTLGGSMGGYASMAFAERLQAKCYISICPQYSLSKKFREKTQESRWKEETLNWSCDHFEQINKLPPGVVIYDPYCIPDKKHVDEIQKRFTVTTLAVKGSGHAPAVILKDYAEVHMFSVIMEIFSMSNVSAQLADCIAQQQMKYDQTEFSQFVQASSEDKLRMIKDFKYYAFLDMLDIVGLVEKFEESHSEADLILVEKYISAQSNDKKAAFARAFLARHGHA